MYIYAVNKKGVSCTIATQGVSWTKIAFLFQMFLILLSSTALGSQGQIPVFKEGQSNTWKSVLFCFFVRAEHAQKPKFEKKNFIRHFARFNFSRLSLAFILKYYPILHAVKR